MATKSARRLEAKKRKASAFLAIATLNDKEGWGRKAKPRLEEHEAVTKDEEKDHTDSESKSKKPRLSDKPQLEGDDYAALREKLKLRKKLLKSLPHFALKHLGEDASVELPVEMRTPIMMNDVQQLLSFMIMGDRMPYQEHMR